MKMKNGVVFVWRIYKADLLSWLTFPQYIFPFDLNSEIVSLKQKAETESDSNRH